MKRPTLRAVTAAVAAVVLIVIVSPIKPAFVRSESLPRGLYAATDFKPRALAREELACFPYERPSWARTRYLYPGEIVCKRVLGLPGDTVTTRTDGVIEICNSSGCLPVGAALSHDSSGRPVAHPTWKGEVIPAGMYYLGSTRRRNSLDSRYLGLVPQTKIVKTLVPLLVEQDN